MWVCLGFAFACLLGYSDFMFEMLVLQLCFCPGGGLFAFSLWCCFVLIGGFCSRVLWFWFLVLGCSGL